MLEIGKFQNIQNMFILINIKIVGNTDVTSENCYETVAKLRGNIRSIIKVMRQFSIFDLSLQLYFLCVSNRKPIIGNYFKFSSIKYEISVNGKTFSNINSKIIFEIEENRVEMVLKSNLHFTPLAHAA